MILMRSRSLRLIVNVSTWWTGWPQPSCPNRDISTVVPQDWLIWKRKLACGFGPCHKVRHAKSNTTQANVQQAFASAATLQSDSQPSGPAFGAGNGYRRPSAKLQSVESFGQ